MYTEHTALIEMQNEVFSLNLALKYVRSVLNSCTKGQTGLHLTG